MIPLVACLCAALSMLAASAAVFAAVWARDGAHKVDEFAAIVLPLLVRLKQRVDPDPMVATVVAAAAAAPPPAIVEAPLPVLVAEEAEEEEERRESAPVHAGPPLTLETVSSDDASEDPGRPTIKTTARPGDEEPYTDTIATPPPVDPRPAVAPRLPPPPVDVAAVRRRAEEQAARFGAEDAEDAVREARDQRQRAEAARVDDIAAEALRPSVEPEDESTKVYSGKVDLGQLLAVEPSPRTLAGGAVVPPPARPAMRDRTQDERITARFLVLVEGASPAAVKHCTGSECIVDIAGTCACSCAPCSRRRWLRTQAQREITRPSTPPPGSASAAVAPTRVGTMLPPASDSGGEQPPRAHKTLVSVGVVQGPRQRFDPRVEPESHVEVTGAHPYRSSGG